MKNHDRERELHYEPIPGPKGQGEIELTICPPSTWFDDPRYVVFVGGCGIGTRTTLKAAEALLLEGTQAYLRRRIDGLEAEIGHWASRLALLSIRRQRDAEG